MQKQSIGIVMCDFWPCVFLICVMGSSKLRRLHKHRPNHAYACYRNASHCDCRVLKDNAAHVSNSVELRHAVQPMTLDKLVLDMKL